MINKHSAGGGARPEGELRAKIVRNLGNLALDRYDAPESARASMWWRIQNMVQRIRKGERMPPEMVLWMGRVFGFSTLTSSLTLTKISPDRLVKSQSERLARLYELLRAGVPVSELYGEFGLSLVNYGIVSRRLITDNGVAFLVDAWQNSVELENMKYHGIGTGNTAAAQTDTALETELTTEYNPDNTRATGSTTEGASANIFRTVGTNIVDSGVSIVEHGLLSQAATGGGVLWDRHVFGAIALVSGDSLQSTYDMTATAGG